MQIAAAVCVAGLDGAIYLRSTDPAERLTFAVVARAAAEMRAEEREDQANRTINALSRSMK